MWEPQVQDLLSRFQVLRYDTRGHGASEVPPGEYSIEQLGRDVLGLVDNLKFTKFAFCGLSLGGAIGQWLAIHAPEQLTGLVLANTSPRLGTRQLWDDRINAVRHGGMAAIVDITMQRFFSPEFLARTSAYVESIRSLLLGNRCSGYCGCCAALREFDFNHSLPQIGIPTLVIVGDRDVSTPWTGNGEILVQSIPQARVARLSAAHLSNLEAPKSFNAALFEFLQPRENLRKTFCRPASKCDARSSEMPMSIVRLLALPALPKIFKP